MRFNTEFNSNLRIVRMVLRLSIFTLTIFLTFNISFADPQGDKDREILLKNSPRLTPDEYKSIKARIDAEEEMRLIEIEKSKASIKMNKAWGPCMKNCYDARNHCFDVGGDVVVCEPLYETCVNNCYY